METHFGNGVISSKLDMGRGGGWKEGGGGSELVVFVGFGKKTKDIDCSEDFSRILIPGLAVMSVHKDQIQQGCDPCSLMSA